jgi:hypothetical protein
MAGSAKPSPRVVICVLLAIEVPAGAVNLLCVLGSKRRSSQGIFLCSYGLKMPRINTSPISTEVVKLESSRDRPAHELVGIPVGTDVLRMADAEFPVSVRAHVSFPSPTPWALLNLGPETFLRSNSLWPSSQGYVRRTVLPEPFIVDATVAMPVNQRDGTFR